MNTNKQQILIIQYNTNFIDTPERGLFSDNYLKIQKYNKIDVR